MKKLIYSFWIVIVVLTSCQDDTNSLFEKSAEERTAEAIAGLKADLVAPSNGWKLNYRPTNSTGSFFVIMEFKDDYTVTLKTDLSSNNGEFFEQTITYRIDSSLGLELIMESYCFFSFLFEQDQATFGAEYEFLYANKTPDGDLVFRSKTDLVNPTILLFEEASASDVNLLGYQIATNLNIIADDLDNFTPSLKLTYTNKNVLLYLSLDDMRRTVAFTTGARKTNALVTQPIDFSTPFRVEGDSIILDSPLSANVFGTSITIRSIKFGTDLTDGSINVCASPIPTHLYAGVTSASDNVTLEPSIVDGNGKSFATVTDFFAASIYNIFNNGENAGNQIAADLTGAQSMQLYYGFDLGQPFYAIGFYLENANGDPTFALREFTPVLNGNNIVFNFTGPIQALGNPDPDADITNANAYLDALTQGGTTYVFEYSENFYEFYNPCTGWTFAFQAVL